MNHSVFAGHLLKEIRKRQPKGFNLFQKKITSSFSTADCMLYVFILKNKTYSLFFRDLKFNYAKFSYYSNETNDFIEMKGFEQGTDEILKDLIKEHDIWFESKELAKSIPAANNKNKKVNKI